MLSIEHSKLRDNIKGHRVKKFCLVVPRYLPIASLEKIFVIPLDELEEQQILMVSSCTGGQSRDVLLEAPSYSQKESLYYWDEWIALQQSRPRGRPILHPACEMDTLSYLKWGRVSSILTEKQFFRWHCQVLLIWLQIYMQMSTSSNLMKALQKPWKFRDCQALRIKSFWARPCKPAMIFNAPIMIFA